MSAPWAPVRPLSRSARPSLSMRSSAARSPGVHEPGSLTRAALAAGEWRGLWIYLAGPLAGAALGADEPALRPPSRGAFDARRVPARVYLRARPRARRGARRAWAAGAEPRDERLVVDLDSFVGEVHGYQKRGAGFGYTRQRGYRPLVATRADAGEVLHVRLHKGSAASPRGAVRLVDELIARQARRRPRPRALARRNALWNKKLIARLEQAGWLCSIGVRLQAWVFRGDRPDPRSSLAAARRLPEAQIAETLVGPRRLVVRRTRLLGAQAELWPDWRHFAFHHQPLGLPTTTVRAALTARRRLLALPGRLTRSARQWTLHLPIHWPWQADLIHTLAPIRALPLAAA